MVETIFVGVIFAIVIGVLVWMKVATSHNDDKTDKK